MVGNAYSYKCGNCACEVYFNQGHGYLVKPQTYSEYLTSNHKLFHYEIRNKIASLGEIHPGLVIDAIFQVYKCPKCNLLHNKVQVTLSDGERLLHTNRFKCSRCRSLLKLTNIHRLKRATCPACGKATFRRQKLGSLL
ncbi:MAG: hypothetical protein KA780_04290 [Prolixibacteraceae bacterium]|nr:hypothetical protein [Prolixibacteraceae bacterium]